MPPADGTQPIPGATPTPAVQPAPAGTENGAPAPNAPAPEAGTDQDTVDVARIMGDTNPGNFMDEFLAGQGVVLDEPPATPEPAPVPPGQSTPPPAAPATPPVNGVPAPTNGPAPAPAAPGTVDPNLLARVLGPPAAQVPPAALPGWPAPAAPPATAQTLPPPNPAPAAEQEWQPFNEPVRLPTEIAAALDNDDPNVRLTAISASMAAVGNAVARQTIQHIKSVILPQAMRATVGHVQETTAKAQIERDLYADHPNLRYASPQLMQQAANVVVQDELSRNPNATYSPEIAKRIAALASAAMQQIAAGQPVVIAPQPPAYAPASQPAPAVVPVQGQDGNWYVRNPQGGWSFYAAAQPPAVAPAPAAPWVAGGSAQPFGIPSQPSATPESEFASFMSGEGW